MWFHIMWFLIKCGSKKGPAITQYLPITNLCIFTTTNIVMVLNLIVTRAIHKTSAPTKLRDSIHKT